MNNIFHKSNDFLCRVQRVHRRLRNVGNLITKDIFSYIIRFHSGNLSSIYNDVTADVMQWREIIAHQGQRQC